MVCLYFGAGQGSVHGGDGGGVHRGEWSARLALCGQPRSAECLLPHPQNPLLDGARTGQVCNLRRGTQSLLCTVYERFHVIDDRRKGNVIVRSTVDLLYRLLYSKFSVLQCIVSNLMR